MDRRAFITMVGASMLAAPLVAEAQQAAKVYRIGMLLTFSPEHPETRASLDQFRQAMRELGYVEGRNIVIEYRSAEGKIERFPTLAAELVRLKVDLIVAGSTPDALAAKHATVTIPIVVITMHDPVKDGLVASLARPGGNVTGSTFLGPELVAKRLELLKEAVPGVSRVAALWHPGAHGERTRQDMVKEAEGAARAPGRAASTRESGGSKRSRERVLRNDPRTHRRTHRVAERDAFW
jgi:putative ABC transport system substrate-binding protein